MSRPRKARASWDISIKEKIPNVLWWSRYGVGVNSSPNRFVTETWRTGERSGNLIIFDRYQRNEEIVYFEVRLRNGTSDEVDIRDILEWRSIISKYLYET